MENIADGVHPLTHFTHFAALWFGEGPLPRGRKKICQQRQKHEASSNLIRDNCKRLPPVMERGVACRVRVAGCKMYQQQSAPNIGQARILLSCWWSLMRQDHNLLSNAGKYA